MMKIMMDVPTTESEQLFQNLLPTHPAADVHRRRPERPNSDPERKHTEIAAEHPAVTHNTLALDPLEIERMKQSGGGHHGTS